MEDLDAYRTICANRIRRLERYRKAKSFCSLETDESTSSEPSSSSTFEMIREKMFSLMENDMTLLQQLLTLGDQINEIKKERLRKAISQNSIDYDEEDEKEDHFETEHGFSASMSAVTNLYVDDDRPQFFSRQNSVLRIPIPPRSSNRFGPRRVIRRPSDVLPRQQSQNIRTLHVNSDDSSSDSSSPSGSETHSPTSSVSNTSTLLLPPQKATKNRSSNSSIDSGIRDEPSTPSPTFESAII